MGIQDRVIFFSKQDLMKVPMLERAEQLLNKIPRFAGMDLNSLLEFHHIHQYFNNGLFLDRWTSLQKEAYQQLIKKALDELRLYLSSISLNDMTLEMGKLEFDNQENFWEVLQYFEIYKKVDGNLFYEMLTTYPQHIVYILPLKQLVDCYHIELRNFLLTYENSAELLLYHYEQKLSEPSKYHFPKSLKDADKHAIILAYLDSASPNLNYVDLVLNSKNLKLTPRILLKAKQTSDRIKDEIFTEQNSMKFVGSSALNMHQSEAIAFEKEGDELVTSYGGAFFDSITDDLKLFSVFAQVFGYTNKEGLINLVSKHTELNVLEKIGMQSRNEYNYGAYFAKKDLNSLSQLRLFEAYLIKKGRSLEELIGSFIHGLFKDNLHIQGLNFAMPDPHLKPIYKIRLLAPEMEYLLKQYKSLVTDGEVNHELLQMDSTPLYLVDIPSIFSKKYVFSNNDRIKSIQYHFFDENSILAAQKNIYGRRPLMQAFEDGKVYRTDFEAYQQHFIDMVVNAGDILINKDDEILITDPVKVLIAGKLRENGYISYWHYHVSFRTELDRLIADGLLETSHKLFTGEEMSYLNFFLNKKEFTNGKDLRNKYLHGSNVHDEEQQQIDYLYFLRTFILILLKMRDDVIFYRHHHRM